ncbi:MAG: AMP-binding protein [bacterium]
MASYNYTNYLEESIQKNWNIRALANYKENAISYGELAKAIYQIHATLESIGVKRGDKIALVSKNSVNWCLVYLATVTYGAVIVPLLSDFKPQDIHELVNHCDAEFAFFSENIYNKIDTKEFKNLKGIFILETMSLKDDFGGIDLKLHDADKIFVSKYESKLTPKKFSLPKNKNSELMVISYTSGTSGIPKGVMLSHRSISANVWYGRKYMPLKTADCILSFLPLAHSYGCTFEFLYPLTLGCFVTLLGRVPSPTIIMEAFREIKPRLILSVPLVVEKIYKKQILPALEDPKVKTLLKIPILNGQVLKKINAKVTDAFGGNFKELVSGGAALNPEVEKFFTKIGLNFTVGYGMTECGPLIAYDSHKSRKVGGTGKPVDTLEVKINSRDPYNIPGEILVKGDNVMDGYYKNEFLTQEALDSDKWLHTGDLGVVGHDGTIYIKGRSKSMILGPSGQNIYPEEIEAVINNYPLVGESLVVEKEGKLIALVAPDFEYIENQKLDKITAYDDILNYKTSINNRLAGYLNVAEIKIMEEEFEKTPKNSIKRFVYTSPNYQVHRIKH